MKFSDVPFKELVVNWGDHLSTFWVPVIIGIIFLGAAIKEITQGHVRLFIFYIILALCCVGYLACSDSIMIYINRLFP